MPELHEELRKIPEGEWVVVSADHKRIVSHDADLKKALDRAQELGESNGMFFKNVSVGESLVVTF